MREISYSQRCEFIKNPTAQKLCYIAEEKQSNLVLSLDLTCVQDCLTMLQQVSAQICMVKTHVDILTDFTRDFVHELQDLARREKFVIFEDRKFADIGHTVQLQYAQGIYKIADWAELITAHTVPGPGIVTGLKEVGLPRGHATVLLAEMSSQGHLLSEDYRRRTIEMARLHADFVIGFISVHRLLESPEFLYLTPGVQVQEGKDNLGQQYLTPQKVIAENKSDFIIVGRGIIKAPNPAETAKQYQAAGWQAYQQRLAAG